MANWQGYKNKMPPSESGDLLKLEDGKPVKIRIVGEPWVLQSEYKGQPSTRFALKFWNYGAKAAQFVMIPKTPLNQILDLAENEEWGDPEQYDITITRTGTGKETEYSVLPSPVKSSLDPRARRHVDSIDLGEALARFPSVSFAIALAEVDDEFWAKRTAAMKRSEPKEEATEPEAVNAEPVDDPRDRPGFKPDVVIEDIGDEPINLDDIPF